jgi:hypothetical protein
MSMKINNRVLGIDSKDVMKCEDLEVLNEWRMNIAMQRSDVLFENSVTREVDLPSGLEKKEEAKKGEVMPETELPF